MFSWRMTAAVLAFLSLSGCDDKKADDSDGDKKLLETVTLIGTCKEDHATIAGEYKATIYRWEHRKPGEAPKIVAFGAAMTTRDLAADLQEEMRDPLKNAGRYYPPFEVDLFWIDIDTSADRWILHGMSDDGEGKQSYATTCDLRVINRTAGSPTNGVAAPTDP